MDTNTLFQKTYDFYKHFYENLRSVAKRERYTWGKECDACALKILVAATHAPYANRETKGSLLRSCSANVDLLKVMLRLGDDLKIIDHKKYLARSGELIEIGKMIGGWMKSIR